MKPTPPPFSVLGLPIHVYPGMYMFSCGSRYVSVIPAMWVLCVRSVSSRSFIFPFIPLTLIVISLRFFILLSFFSSLEPLVLRLFVSLSCTLYVLMSLYGLNLTFLCSFLMASLSMCRFSVLSSTCRGVGLAARFSLSKTSGVWVR